MAHWLLGDELRRAHRGGAAQRPPARPGCPGGTARSTTGCSARISTGSPSPRRPDPRAPTGSRERRRCCAEAPILRLAWICHRARPVQTRCLHGDSPRLWDVLWDHTRSAPRPREAHSQARTQLRHPSVVRPTKLPGGLATTLPGAAGSWGAIEELARADREIADRMAGEEVVQTLRQYRRVLHRREMPGLRHREALGMREPGLYEFASFHEPPSALGSEHIEHGLRYALGIAGPEGPARYGRHLRLEEQVSLASASLKASGSTRSSTAR
jgi:hypothetical protein